MPVDFHRLAELRSLAFHRAAVEKIRADPRVLDAARQRVAGWVRAGGRTSGAAREWEDVLAGSVESICAFLVDPSERATALRQSTPFAGVLSPRDRWRIWRDVRAEMERRPSG